MEQTQPKDSTAWWIDSDGQSFGPYTREQVEALLKARRVPTASRIYDPRKDRWRPAKPGQNGTSFTALITALVAVLWVPLAIEENAPLIAVGFGAAALLLGIAARHRINRATPREKGMVRAIIAMVLGAGVIVAALAAPVLEGFVESEGVPSACRVEMNDNLQAAATAQRNVLAATSQYTPNGSLLESEGGYEPLNSVACTDSPSLVITDTDSGDYCMQMTSESLTLSVRSTTPVREGPC